MTNINKLLEVTLTQAGVPKRFVKDTDKTKYSSAYSAVLAKAKVGGLFLYGEVGTGKTQLAVDIMRDILEEKKSPSPYDQKIMEYDRNLFRFINYPRFLTRVRNSFNDKGEMGLEEYLQKMAQYEYVVLDDFGVEKTSAWVAEASYLIINDFYEREAKAIITSNKLAKEIARSLDDRIASRILEMCESIQLEGGDKRILR